MFKTTDKRFEYDIGQPRLDDTQKYSYKYTNNRSISDCPISATTPVHRRASLNQNTAERYHQMSTQEHIGLGEQEERYGVRSRNSSASGFKRSVEKGQIRNNQRSFVQNQSLRQTKKIYLGDNDDMFSKEGTISHARHEQPNFKRSHRNDQNKRINGEENSFYFSDNHQFTKGNYQGHSRKEERRGNQLPQNNLSEKEIMEKIGRINKLNQEINGRLQRMLSKIQRP